MTLKIRGLGTLERGEEGEILRGLVGMLIKRRTADADKLEFNQDSVRKFLEKYTVGVTRDDVAGCYTVMVQRRPEDDKRLEALPA